MAKASKTGTEYCDPHFRSVPIHTHRAFKAWCARRGYSMTDAITYLMRYAVTRDPLINATRRTKKDDI